MFRMAIVPDQRHSPPRNSAGYGALPLGIEHSFPGHHQSVHRSGSISPTTSLQPIGGFRLSVNNGCHCSMYAMTEPTATVAPSTATNSATVPDTGEGTSASTFYVLTTASDSPSAI